MSVADAFNLAWKLALVEKGLAGRGLLDTYSLERQPAGAAGVARALQSAFEAARFETGLGYTRGQSEEDGWAELAKLDSPGPEGDARRTALAEQVHIANNQFNAHGIELGHCYDDGALVHDGSVYSTNPRDPVLFHHPTTRPGARVAHARVERKGVPVSTLDLVDGLSFSLFTGRDDAPWVTAARMVSNELGVGIVVHRIGSAEVADPYGDWQRVREIDDGGCVLVRPDRHVGWRSPGAKNDPQGELMRAMRVILARQLPDADYHPTA